MQKVVIILFIIIYLTGCSVSEPLTGSGSVNMNFEESSVGLNDLVKQNITSNSFLIQKAEVELTDQGEKQKFFATIRFNRPDSFLISVRSTSGIEAVRIFTTNDTILINDRLNKTFFYGSQEAAKKKYGLNSLLFPVLMGDVILSQGAEATPYKCERGVVSMSSVIAGNKIDYTVNCENLKAFGITITREIDTKPVILKYSEFKKLADFNFAERVRISNLNNIDLITVKLSKIQVPWDGDIVFVPGSNYEQIEIK